MTDFAQQNLEMIALLQDERRKVADRGDMLTYAVCEHGIDMRPAVNQLIEDADLGRKLRDLAAERDAHTLAPERYLGPSTLADGKLYAMVTRGHLDVYLPARREQLEALKFGDPILVDTKEDRLVGRDGHAPISGEVVMVDARPACNPSQVIVTHNDRRQMARLPHELARQPNCCGPGSWVVFDAVRRFVLGQVDAENDGQDLLMSLDKLAAVTRHDVGAPQPVVEEILERFRIHAEAPDWYKTMQARDRCSYLFQGATGSGKSYTLALIANLTADVTEEVTGQRSSRIVMVDASQFWSPLFGQTEQRIAEWADKLSRLGARQVCDKQGQPVRLPLIIVLEECESLMRARGEQSSGHLFDRPLALILQKTQSLENALRVPIIWIATTNRPDLVDPAALRRIGMRQVTFSTLSVAEAREVLLTKFDPSIPIAGEKTNDNEQARMAAVQRILGYLYGPEPKQAIAEVQFANSETRHLNRSDLVTPALLEEAVSMGIDQSLFKSRRAGRLVGMDVHDVLEFLHRHFAHMARTVRSHNVAEHCPEWFTDDSRFVNRVVPLLRRNRRSLTTLG